MCKRAVHYCGNTTNTFKHGKDNKELQQRRREECVQPIETDSTQLSSVAEWEGISMCSNKHKAMNALKRRLKNVCPYSRILRIGVFADVVTHYKVTQLCSFVPQERLLSLLVLTPQRNRLSEKWLKILLLSIIIPSIRNTANKLDHSI